MFSIPSARTLIANVSKKDNLQQSENRFETLSRNAWSATKFKLSDRLGNKQGFVEKCQANLTKKPCEPHQIKQKGVWHGFGDKSCARPYSGNKQHNRKQQTTIDQRARKI
jgi:hypothetical protein